MFRAIPAICERLSIPFLVDVRECLGWRVAKLGAGRELLQRRQQPLPHSAAEPRHAAGAHATD
jgi:hypothetical protein